MAARSSARSPTRPPPFCDSLPPHWRTMFANCQVFHPTARFLLPTFDIPGCLRKEGKIARYKVAKRNVRGCKSHSLSVKREGHGDDGGRKNKNEVIGIFEGHFLSSPLRRICGPEEKLGGNWTPFLDQSTRRRDSAWREPKGAKLEVVLVVRSCLVRLQSLLS